MSRAAWGGVMVLSLAATAGSGYYMLQRSAVTLGSPAPAAQPAPMPPPPVTAPAPEEEKAPEENPAPQTRNILFRFPRPTAKSVAIVGDFNEWKRQAMDKKEKGWEISLPLQAGEYHYLFVVDNKRVKDPNNKLVKDGKSVINVKPLAP